MDMLEGKVEEFVKRKISSLLAFTPNIFFLQIQRAV
eukprot:CAMPEP_0173134908 /NCGR_PEP_ID=MMETSP1105-20130129/1575_1 /TAXON_ID=2985 /ORGANISM="Ochromonas sp., Strain BG-1" /LENGTH=35 /DNA_ID= /DNA_START= /DNA_END= /DNA_ORIENTATION=